MAKKTTKDTLFSMTKKVEMQRMRICIEIDVPDDNFYRENFNSDVLEMTTEFENKHKGGRLVLVTTEEVVK